jgi:hypothetical protein
MNAIVNRSAIQRLTALWAFSEAGLGGIMHAFRTPFTGLIVGGMAVVFITLIAREAKHPGSAILRALTLVLLVKLAVSPHSPIPAYFAVAFQGLLGALLFSVLPGYRLPAFLLGVLALLESAFQKVITLTLIFGLSLWESIDTFAGYVAQQLGVHAEAVQASWWLIAVYGGIYLVGGIFVGWLAGYFPEALRRLDAQPPPIPDLTENLPLETPGKRKKSRWKRLASMLLLLAAIMVVLLTLQSDGKQQAWLVLVRVLAILVLWFGVLAPLMVQLLRRILQRQKQQYQLELDQILELLPILRKLALAAWNQSREGSSLLRIWRFLLHFIWYGLRWEENISPHASPTV